VPFSLGSNLLGSNLAPIERARESIRLSSRQEGVKISPEVLLSSKVVDSDNVQ
jgi:hypothetical protein